MTAAVIASPAARDVPILSVSFAMHECRRYLKLARRPPKGYRLRALERRSAQLHEQLRREVRDTPMEKN